MIYGPHLEIIRSETLKKSASHCWWLQAASVDIENSAARKILLDIDKICLHLEKEESNGKELLSKIKSFLNPIEVSYYLDNYTNFVSIKKLSTIEQEKRRQFWDFVNELRACIWLLDNDFSCIKLIPKSKKDKKKTPDIFAKKLNNDWFIEVKTLHNPREEESRLLEEKPSVRDVDRNYADSLKYKLDFFVSDANLKFNDAGAINKILIIFTNYSISAYLQNKNISLKEYRNALDLKGMDIVEIKE